MESTAMFRAGEGIVIRAPQRATYKGIRRALRQLEPVLRGGADDGPRRIILDMSSVRYCSATGITILAAAMQHLYQEGKVSPNSEILLPDRQWIRAYFESMKFFKELGVGMESSGAPETQSQRRGVWPVTHVSNDHDSPHLTSRILNALAEYQEFHPEARAALASCVNEIIENVFYHALSPIDALVAAQASRKTKKTELVIADTGLGIRPGLAKCEAYRDRTKTDSEAIKLALEKHVSAVPDRFRGIGLWLASELVRRNAGQMLILSNEGGIDICGRREEFVEGYFWPGTLVAVEFDLDKPIRTREVYDSGQFADIDSYDF